MLLPTRALGIKEFLSQSRLCHESLTQASRGQASLHYESACVRFSACASNARTWLNLGFSRTVSEFRRNAAKRYCEHRREQVVYSESQTCSFEKTSLASSGASRLRLVPNHDLSGELNWSSDCPPRHEDLVTIVVVQQFAMRQTS